ncbi:type I-C CRISPR-associated protein Cas8c/Csd1 [Pseudoramibacter alactolyticus]|jgi:CRISPR-associated protein Csd1|uniref:type I-C CRISPR-associated protein Cas8c/Csd1 n=1 Tax=Pseudoramibacter alactolyticus TaxID=113287 RepID=UPI0023522CA5|nr:type I-C CRISPR-associated protein Cas8c/Csd1 [Pseudoramibacter alactolyticus]MBM6967927.1 type I-C CRISPR-associated protein Cas8c/Csd1 [Pseudoramibacter alactolyticus]
MLINALCDYYQLLIKAGKLPKPGYTEIEITHTICLTPDGKIDRIIDNRREEVIANSKRKRVIIPGRSFPDMPTASAVKAIILDYRPAYIFGLTYDKANEQFTSRPQKKNGKISDKEQKSHDAFVKMNLDIIDGLDSPVINAYRAFLQNWQPEVEIQNPVLLGIAKEFNQSRFDFCLADDPIHTLQKDPLMIAKWEQMRQAPKANTMMGKDAVDGEEQVLARIHDKIKHIAGGQMSGTVLVGFNNASEESYGNKQSFNSGIGEHTMKRYTAALNYLTANSNHKITIGETSVLFWAMTDDDRPVDLMTLLINAEAAHMSPEAADALIGQLFSDLREGAVSGERLSRNAGIDPSILFYIVGIKPNASRLSIKFMERQATGQMLAHAAEHQANLQIGPERQLIPLWRIARAMVPEKSSQAQPSPALVAKLFDAIVKGTPYPENLLATMIRRVKTERQVSHTRAAMIKACINRRMRMNNEKNEEVLQVALDTTNSSPAYVCGRFFAVLEKIQQDASGGKLNRTIKDAYFASASSNPAMVFPKLIKLSQSHLKKLGEGSRVYYQRLMTEIIALISGEFPKTQSLQDQGKFMIGYYHQNAKLYEKRQ